MTAEIASASARWPILIRPPSISSSIKLAMELARRDAVLFDRTAGGGSCFSRIAGTNIGASRDRTDQAVPHTPIWLRSKRGVRSRDDEMAWRRAIALTLYQPEQLSAMIEASASASQSRRLPAPVKSSKAPDTACTSIIKGHRHGTSGPRESGRGKPTLKTITASPALETAGGCRRHLPQLSRCLYPVAVRQQRHRK